MDKRQYKKNLRTKGFLIGVGAALSIFGHFTPMPIGGLVEAAGMLVTIAGILSPGYVA